jgi:hypothetical protein
MLLERLFDAFAYVSSFRFIPSEFVALWLNSPLAQYRDYNESIVHSSVQFHMERQQLEQRLRLDAPTRTDPVIRDLLHESDMFARSFTSLGRGFGIFSPFDIIHTLSLVAELASQLVILCTASGMAGSSLFSFGTSSADPARPQLSLLGVFLLPSLISFIASRLPAMPFSTASGGDQCGTPYTAAEFSEYERMNRMRSLATLDSYHSEVALFGLAPWILSSWSDSRKRILGLDASNSNNNRPTLSFGSGLRWLLTQTNVSEMLVLVQNVGKQFPPFNILQRSSHAIVLTYTIGTIYSSRSLFILQARH